MNKNLLLTQKFHHSEVIESINTMQIPSVHTLNTSILSNVSYLVSSKMNWKKHNFNKQDLIDSVNIFQNPALHIPNIRRSSNAHYCISFSKTAHNTCQKEINQHQSTSKPKEINNLSELSGPLKTLSYPSLCTPSISKSSNALDSYCQ
jgi:hypothetical protein